MTKPTVFQYDDYRKYLRDIYKFMKSTTRSFSFRSFAKDAGLSSPNYLKLVMDGDRNLSTDTIRKFSVALKLNRQEADFFENMVNFNQAASTQDKNLFFQRMSRSHKFRQIKEIEKAQYDFYSQWYVSAIRELVTLPEFKEDPEWIASVLFPRISVRQASDALELLVKLDLLKRDAQGKLIQKDVTIASAPEVRSLALKSFHHQMLDRAKEALDQVSSEDRDITALTLGVVPEQIEDLKKRILKFRREVLVHVGSRETPSENVYQMNIQLFPLTRPKSIEEKNS